MSRRLSVPLLAHLLTWRPAMPPAMSRAMSVESFVVGIPQATLDDLQVRLAATRMVSDDEADDANSWNAGTSPSYLRELLHYWRSDFDWRAQEAKINRFE